MSRADIITLALICIIVWIVAGLLLAVPLGRLLKRRRTRED